MEKRTPHCRLDVNTRTVLPDPTAQQTLLNRSYAMLSSDAANTVSDWFKTHSPFGVNYTVFP